MLTWIGHTHSKNENVPSLTPVERLPLPAGTIVHSFLVRGGTVSTSSSPARTLSGVSLHRSHACCRSLSSSLRLPCRVSAGPMLGSRWPVQIDSVAPCFCGPGGVLLRYFLSFWLVVFFFFKERERTLSWIGRKVGRLWERLR